MEQRKAAVFILLGQSNAVGHGIPMKEEEQNHVPMKNVFGLHREQNQSFHNAALRWQGYTSCGMNLAEQQDDTWSVANCLAREWQAHIDAGNAAGLPDLHIVHIAIGAQGVTEEYMWHPAREEKLIPGKLGEVDISLFPYCRHIFSLLDASFRELEKDYEILGLHWRGGENDMTAELSHLEQQLEPIYAELFGTFNDLLDSPPTVLHRIVCPDRANDLDPSGKMLERMHYINSVFEALQNRFDNISVFDVRRAPQYVPDIRGNGLFGEDVVHFTPEVNFWVAQQILAEYADRIAAAKNR